MSLLLGVDVYDELSICRFCGRVLDCKGIHALSCMAGGDVVLRHNAVRDILYWFFTRGRLAPQLEKVGLLENDAILVNLRRPADVLANVRAQSSDQRRLDRTAIDVKVINGMGQGHFEQSLLCGRTAAETYRADQLEHLDTHSLCAVVASTTSQLFSQCRVALVATQKHCWLVLRKRSARRRARVWRRRNLRLFKRLF